MILINSHLNPPHTTPQPQYATRNFAVTTHHALFQLKLKTPKKSPMLLDWMLLFRMVIVACTCYLSLSSSRHYRKAVDAARNAVTRYISHNPLVSLSSIPLFT